jgi:hypothetical protein
MPFFHARRRYLSWPYPQSANRWSRLRRSRPTREHTVGVLSGSRMSWVTSPAVASGEADGERDAARIGQDGVPGARSVRSPLLVHTDLDGVRRGRSRRSPGRGAHRPIHALS